MMNEECYINSASLLEQVKRAEAHLLEQLYAHMTDLQRFEAESLLDEDPDLLQRRAATKQALLLSFLGHFQIAVLPLSSRS